MKVHTLINGFMERFRGVWCKKCRFFVLYYIYNICIYFYIYYVGKKEPQINVFSGLIKCVNCGKSYRRVTSNGTVGYNCSTYVKKGKSVCYGKKIPEITLQTVTAEVLNLKCFDENIFTEQIEKILVPGPNKLIFIFKDGHEVIREWKDRSRSEVWTEEIKEQARKKTIERSGGDK